MEYRAIKVLNNNVVLARIPDGGQVLLMAKGIGFGVRKGDLVSADRQDQQVMTILDDRVDTNRFKELSFDIEQVELVTRQIVREACNKLDIQNDKLFAALFDHISFAVERLKIGLPIENPFAGEIAILCAREYEVADRAAALIREKLSIDIGESERGFIALHLYSARRNKPINTAMKDARVYKQTIEMLSQQYNRELSSQSAASKSFLMSLNRLLSTSFYHKKLEMPLKQYVKLGMREYHSMAQEISKMIEKEIGIVLDEDAQAFLAVDICKMLQM